MEIDVDGFFGALASGEDSRAKQYLLAGVDPELEEHFSPRATEFMKSCGWDERTVVCLLKLTEEDIPER